MSDWEFKEKSAEEIREQYPGLFLDDYDHLEKSLEIELAEMQASINKRHEEIMAEFKEIENKILNPEKPKGFWYNLFHGKS